MKQQSHFSPTRYLKVTTRQRRVLFARTALGSTTLVAVLMFAASLTGYGDYIQAGTVAAKGYDVAREAVLPSYRSYQLKPLPGPQQELNGSVIEDTEQAVDESDYYSESGFGDNGCNVLGITISGDLGTKVGDSTSDYIRDTLDAYRGDVSVKAILVEVDSGGGSPVAGDEIKTLLEEQTVPVIAQIRELGASAAYLAILSADHIFAHRYADVGSIGVIIPYYDYSGQNEKDGIKYDPIKTGVYKDTASGNRPLSPEERQLLQDDINYIYEGFVNDVAKYRGLSVEQVKTLADGKVWLAHTAVELGLIDEVGGRPEVTKYLKNLIKEEPVVCWN